MPLPGRIFASDEELGKKSDDHKALANGTIPIAGLSWTKWNAAPRVRRRRLLVVLGVLVFLYYFFKNIPTDLVPVPNRVDVRVPGQTIGGRPLSNTPQRGSSPQVSPGALLDTMKDDPPRPSYVAPSEKYYFNGPIRFHYLGPSLHGIARTMGYRDSNQNVLFASANLQSASRMIPLACEMSKWKRNMVHFAFMGRDDILLDELLKVNGVDETCEVFWHDARPDYAKYSIETRMKESVRGALEHIWTFMHPQVYLIDGTEEEEPYFIKSLRAKARTNRRTVVELPADAVQRIGWLTRLDAGSLRSWHDTSVEILVQAPTEGSGSLIRLLRTMESADYTGFRHPHLTIDLPPNVPRSTLNFLKNFVWPPLGSSNGQNTPGLTLRHRISGPQLSPTVASLRFLESFYPASPSNSHVLILSPNVELSPLYYQYLLYHVLEYHHSNYFAGTSEAESLMGISISLPTLNLDGETNFTPPSKAIEKDENERTPGKRPVPFLWHAPNPDAALVFGTKWLEFHDFLSRRISLPEDLQPKRKMVANAHPAWAEYMHELIRARGYTFLFPSWQPQTAIATVHNELYHLPEEFTTPSLQQPVELEEAPNIKDEFFVPPKGPPQLVQEEKPLARTPLTALLPKSGLPEISAMPIVDNFGNIIDIAKLYQSSTAFAQNFRNIIGGCGPDHYADIRYGSAEDLFCKTVSTEGNAEGARPLVDGEEWPQVAVPKGVKQEGNDWLPVNERGNVSPGEEKGMHNEFLKHLERQGVS